MLSPRCQVLRDGTQQQIESADLVPGDIVQIAAGDLVPADLRLCECLNLKVDKSSLTCEAISVVKLSDCVLEETLLAQQSSMAWMGTAVALGMDPAEVSVMSRPPRDLKKPILDRFGVLLVLGLGADLGLESLWLFHHYLAIHGEEGLLLAQTPAFTAIVLIEKANVLNFRSLDSPLFRVVFFKSVGLGCLARHRAAASGGRLFARIAAGLSHRCTPVG
jgi:magnesium-transporting ATPase (P-type)